MDAGHPGDPTTAVRIPTLVADTIAEATRETEALMKALQVMLLPKGGRIWRPGHS